MRRLLLVVVLGSCGRVAFDEREAAPEGDAQVVPPTAGLIGYWPFDNDFTDASGNGHPGAAQGTPGFAAGVLGTGIELVAADADYVSIGDLGTWTSATVSFWMRPALARTAGDDFPNPFSAEPTWDDNIRGDYQFSQEQYVVSDLGMCNTPPSITPRAPRGSWTHVVFAYDAGTHLATQYLDGEVVRTTGITCMNMGHSFNSSFPNVSFGRGYGPGREWDGMLDEAAMWSRALDPGEIAALYNHGSPVSLLRR